MQTESNSTDCLNCHKPLTWTGRSKRIHQGHELYEFYFRCDSCRREFRFRDGRLEELKIERDPVAEQMALRKAEIEAVRNRRCPQCGGPLDNWLTCEWCHERHLVNGGELVARIEDTHPHKPAISDFYAIPEKIGS